MDILTIVFIAGALILGVIAGFLIAGSKLNASATKEKQASVNARAAERAAVAE